MLSLPVAPASLSAQAPNRCHVIPVLGDGLAALRPGLAGFLAGELVRLALFVGRLSAHRGDGLLRLGVHRAEPTLSLRRHRPVIIPAVNAKIEVPGECMVRAT